MFLENRDREEIDHYIKFYKELGLPTTLSELGLGDAKYEDIVRVGQAATTDGETVHNMPV